MLTLPLVDEFLSVYCDKNKKSYRWRLISLEEHLNKLGIQDIKDVKKQHLEDWATNVVEPLKFAQITKRSYYTTMCVYLHYLYDNEIITQIPPLSKRIQFSDNISIKKIELDARPIPDENDILKLLNYAKNASPLMYIYLMILVHNGPRDSEIRSIKLENIKHIQTSITDHRIKQNLDFYVVLSGQVKNHSKTGSCFYFIPKFLIESYDWQLYLDELKRRFSNPTYLFQTTESNFITHNSTGKSLNRYKEKLGLKCKVNPHIFRDLLNELRIDEGCPEPLLSILLNQKGRGTNAQYYRKRCHRLEYRYKYWEKFTPMFYPDQVKKPDGYQSEQIILELDTDLKKEIEKRARESGLTLKNYILSKITE